MRRGTRCPDCSQNADTHIHAWHCLGYKHREKPRVSRGSFWETWGYPNWPPGHDPEMLGPCRRKVACKLGRNGYVSELTKPSNGNLSLVSE